ncbi:unnamed protein product [Chironomus riparius]|uniref:Peptidase S1 domain-containing protein n=1 Tax=Chironomus riparius TaxID=315576 RepID=A0A9N9S654_9DIPT|nr:unnamed protein product [Chironomus riparius]
MKLLIIILSVVLNLVSAKPLEDELKLFELNLEVPSDPDKWIYQGVLKRDGRISNGQQASNTQFPWTAELSINLNNGGLLCTASLISNKWILGARHCIADTNAVSVQASLGSADRQANRVKVFADKFVWLNSASGTNHPDIALFQLSQTVALNSYVNSVRLPAKSQASLTYEGQTITAAGWGGVGGGALSRYLQWTQFRVLSLSQCDLGIYLCSQPASGSSSLEGGDSGGPSVIYENGTPTIVGINVMVVTSGSNKYQGSTRVNRYLGFISDVTGISLRS